MAKTPTKPDAPKAAPASAVKPTAPTPVKVAKGKTAPPPSAKAAMPTTSAPDKVRTITINQMVVAYAEKHELSHKNATGMQTKVFDTVMPHVKTDKEFIPVHYRSICCCELF